MTEPMHADEIDTDADLVRRLLRAQHPQWADLPIERLASDGTDHAIYRLGEELVARLPRIHWAAGQVASERPTAATVADPLEAVDTLVGFIRALQAVERPGRGHRRVGRRPPRPGVGGARRLDPRRSVHRQRAGPRGPGARSDRLGHGLRW